MNLIHINEELLALYFHFSKAKGERHLFQGLRI